MGEIPNGKKVVFCCWLACTLSLGNAITVFNNVGDERTRYGTILSFDISSKSEMHCFYERFERGAKLRIKTIVSLWPENIRLI